MSLFISKWHQFYLSAEYMYLVFIQLAEVWKTTDLAQLAPSSLGKMNDLMTLKAKRRREGSGCTRLY